MPEPSRSRPRLCVVWPSGSATVLMCTTDETSSSSVAALAGIPIASAVAATNARMVRMTAPVSARGTFSIALPLSGRAGFASNSDRLPIESHRIPEAGLMLRRVRRSHHMMMQSAGFLGARGHCASLSPSDAPAMVRLRRALKEARAVQGVEMSEKKGGRQSRPTFTDQEALLFHSQGRPGKLEVVATKPMATQRDLSLAYSPGVAVPVLAIAEDESLAYEYTVKGNFVAVITNGTAILGLGNRGALAAKPVMEGKAVLFKRFADIDSIDLEVNTEDPDEFINCVKFLGKGWGGINLEDIKAPECFIIEQRLRELLDIPVFHDDQHGTAIIATAGLLNSLDLTGRKIEDTKIVCNGAGAAGIACLELLRAIGFRPENLTLCDTKGVIYEGRTEGMNQWKSGYAVKTKARTLADALKGADVFYGLSAKGAVTKDMVASMASKPIIFAMANPDPEITAEEVAEVRDDAIMATGRSDYPNQVNNVLGFPYIFRGALDVRATTINMEMKIAAARALAALAREDVPDEVAAAYGTRPKFGPDYIIPVPFDPRLISHVPPAVAKAAMDTGVARKPIEDMDAYR